MKFTGLLFSRQLIVTLIAAINTAVAGFVLGFTSPTVPQMGDILVDKDQVSWFGSLAMIGAAFGGLCASFPSNKFGRKMAMLLCSLPYSAGWMTIINADNHVMLYIGRLLTGVGFGMAVPSASIYISETAQKQVRGMFSSLNVVVAFLGILLAYCLGLALSWRWLAVAGQALTTFSVLMLVWVPESPRYLLMKGDREAAKASLMWLRPASNKVDKELAEIQDSVSQHQSVRCSDAKVPHVYKPTIILVGLMIFQETSGITAVSFYAETIYRNAGFDKSSQILSVVTVSTRLFCCISAMLLVDHIGRRVLLFLSGVGLVVGWSGMGTHFYLMEHHIFQSQWLSVASLLLVVSSQSIGWGMIPWVYQGELFEARLRAFSGVLASFVSSLFAFVIGQTFLQLQDAISTYGAFWLYAGVSLLAIIFVVFFVPETKGKSLEEIVSYFSSKAPRNTDGTNEVPYSGDSKRDNTVKSDFRKLNINKQGCISTVTVNKRPENVKIACNANSNNTDVKEYVSVYSVNTHL